MPGEHILQMVITAGLRMTGRRILKVPQNTPWGQGRLSMAEGDGAMEERQSELHQPERQRFAFLFLFSLSSTNELAHALTLLSFSLPFLYLLRRSVRKLGSLQIKKRTNVVLT